ncbi:MAG: 4Fe-4S dicluster domain-containing protein [Pseudomonadota bacterium]
MTEINLDHADPKFKDEVAALRGAERIKLCYACGVCSARCPVGEINSGFDPRRIIRLIVLGLREEVLAGPWPWICSTCFTCQETCPQGVKFTEVMFAIKNMAARAGHFPPGLSAQPDLLRAKGRLYEISDFENQKRAELDLPPLEEAPAHFEIILRDFHLKSGGGD